MPANLNLRIIVFSCIGYLVFSTFFYIFFITPDSPVLLLYFLSAISMAITPFLFVLSRKITFNDVGIKKEIVKKDIIYGITGGILCVIAGTVGQWVIKEIFHHNISVKDHDLAQLFVVMEDIKHRIGIIFIAAVVAPVCEEIFFRGVIMGGLMNTLNPLNSIWISALLFALLHQNKWMLLPVFIIGLVQGIVYYKTRNILSVIISHIINNLVAFLSIMFV